MWGNVGLDVEGASPKAQTTTPLAVLIPVVPASVAVLVFSTIFWWLTFLFGWALSPAFGLLLRGIAGMSEGRSRGLRGTNDGERGLPGGLREREEITPARAAMETSLTVEEADGTLEDLAARGHLGVRVRGGSTGAASSTVSGAPGARRTGGSTRADRYRGAVSP